MYFSKFNSLLILFVSLIAIFYALPNVVTKFNLKPLVFHVDGGWNTSLAVNNIQMLVEKLGLELYTEVINWEEMKDLQLAFFKSGLPHLDLPQDHAKLAGTHLFAPTCNDRQRPSSCRSHPVCAVALPPSAGAHNHIR